MNIGWILQRLANIQRNVSELSWCLSLSCFHTADGRVMARENGQELRSRLFQLLVVVVWWIFRYSAFEVQVDEQIHDEEYLDGRSDKKRGMSQFLTCPKLLRKYEIAIFESEQHFQARNLLGGNGCEHQ
eukprot:Pompholyxophrys_punicea_v1_NODE_1327_length_788_cov_2.712142.p2 type:complete len:129 gc:universal NODE_1327_length_788_cov_2.712142:329-715(+)